MLLRSPSLHACLAWLVAVLVLACHPSSGPVTPLAPPAPRTRAEPLPPPPPVSLTASDGTGLVLASLRARTVIDDPLALTELELAFDNPRPDVIEGRFELLLPPGARVTRFALLVDGQWREAEVVERLAARQVYEIALYEDRDPALLERDTGNRFGARVFPIEPYGRKQILVSYVESFADPREPWRMAVNGLPGLELLELEALVVDPTGGIHRLQRNLPTGQAPTADFVVPRDAPHDDGVRHGEQVTARIQPLAGIDLGDAAPLQQLTVLVDTSASRALDFDASLASLARVLQALGRLAGTAKLRVLAFDQEVVPIYSGSLLGFGPDALAALHARRPLGASDLGLALRALEDGEHPRVLLVSDGLVSMGEESDAALRRQLQALAAKGVERLDALVLGRVRDEARLQRLVTGPLPDTGVLLRPELPPERAAARLAQPTLDGVRVAVPGARWWSPRRLDGLQPDDHVLVHADLPVDQPLRVQISGPVHRDVEVPLRATSSPLHEQGWRQAQIEGLVERLAALQDELESTRLRRHVIELSVRHRIVNDLTALLVLESDDDYARFGLDRRALEDLMVVGPSGAELLRRREPEPEPPPITDGSEPSPSPPPIAHPGRLRGTVEHRESGVPIAGALMILQCTCLQASREVTTDHGGRYAFDDLPPGSYTIEVLSGQADVSKVFTLPRGASFRANFKIDPENEFRRAIRVASRRSLRRSNRRAQREEDGRGGQGIGFGMLDTDDKPAASPSPSGTTAPGPVPNLEEPVTKLEAEDEDGTPDELPPDVSKTPEPTPEEPVTEPEDGGDGGDLMDEHANAPAFGSVTPREPVTEATVTGRTVTMEEFRNLPVGSATTRDFTAVVDSSTTASRDSAGISLQGTTAAESEYLVEGASITSTVHNEPLSAKVHLRRTSFTGPNMRARSIRRWLRGQLDPVERCYYRALAQDPSLGGRLVIRLETHEGEVLSVGKLEQDGLEHPELLRCLDQAIRQWEVPWQAKSLTPTLVFHPNNGPPDWFWYEPEPVPEPAAASSPFTKIEELLARGERGRALALAAAWRERAPVDVLALVALGNTARAHGDLRRAARAYGSIIDLYPSRADMLRFAAANLEALEDPTALDVAIDAYRRAVAQRPDHPTGHRNLALALLRRGQPEAAFDVLERALALPYPPDRFAGAHQVLRDDLGIAAAAWLRHEPTRVATIQTRLAVLGVPQATAPTLRMVLTWESDVSDVDLHVFDGNGGHAFAQQPVLPSGGQLVADVNNGFGPECFVVPDPAAGWFYFLRVHYYARGPMGYGMGKVAVLHHDGAGGLQFADRPFVALEDDAWIHAGALEQAGTTLSLD